MEPGSKEANDAIKKHLQKIAKINDDDIILYIGIGAHGKEGKGVANIDWKALGPSIAATALGDKLLQIMLPLVDDFLNNNLEQWIKDNQELIYETSKNLSERPKA